MTLTAHSNSGHLLHNLLLYGRSLRDLGLDMNPMELKMVTAIEILSPVNKRPGHEAFESYQRKRRDVMRSEAHLLEIDLLRTGSRFPVVTPLPDAPYFVFLSRAGRRSKWRFGRCGFKTPSR